MASKSRQTPTRLTLKDVAKAAGVSTAAASYAFTRPSRLSNDLRTRVLEAARRLGYPGPDPMARNLRRGRTGVVGVVTHDALPEAFKVPSTILFLQGVASGVESANMCVSLIPGSLRKMRNLQSVSQAAVDGLIVYCLDDRDSLVDAVLARNVPTVLVDSEAIESVPTVGIDSERAARTAAEHLLQLGHRRIGIIVSNPRIDATSGMMSAKALGSAVTSSDFRRRFKGYAQAFREAGVPWNDSVSAYCAEHSWNGGNRAARALLGLNPRPTAMLATSDQLALGAMAYMQETGLRVPADVSVVGFDDIPEARLAKPSLTTIQQPLVDKGFWAGQILVALTRREEVSSPVVLPTRLVIRESTAPPAGIIDPINPASTAETALLAQRDI